MASVELPLREGTPIFLKLYIKVVRNPLLTGPARTDRSPYLQCKVHRLLIQPHSGVDVNTRLLVVMLQADTQTVLQVKTHLLGILVTAMEKGAFTQW